ncbi:DUF1877 family protein [Streptomyces sp. NPDC048197]|uniref:DUF1877 family protein n=1 Tax=Streptomyces sp. NPDC048197 TaxID=3365511 RepID=UPI00371EF57E
MSIHLHLRAVAESEIRDDHTWLAEFMWKAWENHPDEYAAGIADSINKVWSSVDAVYAAAEVLEADADAEAEADADAGTDAGTDIGADADKPWTLPIYGGRPVAHSVDADPSNPPMMFLEPPGVSQAAHFLASVSFDELWNVAGPKLVGRGWDEAQARQEFLDHHRSLQGFYARAAAAGHGVVKVVWA